MENKKYLSEQLITYFGNKRSLLDFINNEIEAVSEAIGKDKMVTADLFSGSGVIARLLKQHSSVIYANDLEGYSETINKCYLSNRSEVDFKKLYKELEWLEFGTQDAMLKEGIIARLYAPKDDNNIQEGERVFYTNRNAKYIDTARQLIEFLPEEDRKYFIAPLLSEASSKANNAASFKGFYTNSETGIGQFGGNGKNALKRILANIELQVPILSNYDCESVVYKEDANKLATKLKDMDLVYLDPPYNQHPYSSNYHMLNTINDYVEPKEISKKVGIPKDWNKSNYNKKNLALDSMRDLVKELDSKYILISFNSDGFITKDEMEKMLSDFGKVQTKEHEYNVFRGGKNLNQRESGIKLSEYLYVLEKK